MREHCEKILGPEIGPGKTEKAATMNKLEVRERECDKLVCLISPGRTGKASTVDKLAVRERSMYKKNPEIGPGKTKKAAIMDKLEVRERVREFDRLVTRDKLTEREGQMNRQTQREKAEPLRQKDSVQDKTECKNQKINSIWAIGGERPGADRAEHWSGQAEQRCGDAPVRDTHPVTLCPTIPGPVARYVNFQLNFNVQTLTTQTPGYSPTVDQAEHLHMPELNHSIQAEDQCQAELPQGEEEEAELNSSQRWRQEGSKPREQATNPDGDQAEQRIQRMSGGGPDAPSRFLSLKHVRQCHTKPWPVARYVDPTVSINNVQSLTTNFDKEMV